MQIKRAAAIPLIVQDPYTSVWCGSDHLYDSDTMHWSGLRQKIEVFLALDDKKYRLIGKGGPTAFLPQKEIDVTATKTTAVFENDKVRLELSFTTPFLLDDLYVTSRPCTYIDACLTSKTSDQAGAAGSASLEVVIYSDLVSRDENAALIFPEGSTGSGRFISMGRAEQHPLGNSGDNITIDWGYAYLASEEEGVVYSHDRVNGSITATIPLLCSEGEQTKAHLLFAFDDLVSVNYFGQWLRGYWTKKWPTILEAIDAAIQDREKTEDRACELDREIEEKALAAGGEEYVFLCDLSYRHTIAAHKLTADLDGTILFLSKEDDSNGCIGTVDVSYPSVPLFLWKNAELVKGMLRPVFRFAKSDAWTFDFAPHDVGRYPYAWGQVYGLSSKKDFYDNRSGMIMPPIYMYRGKDGLFDLKYQMPVEECGNMIIMTAAVCMADGNASFAGPYWEELSKWKEYLVQYGQDPGEQLCTDDFAGHLSHNVNLSVKAIMGVEAYGKLCALAGQKKEAEEAHEKAVKMARSWQARADAGDHYSLVFGDKESWSLKYNMVWDRLFGSGLFSKEVADKELAEYIRKTNRYGVPLDSREDYTKSDWILWTAAMTDDKEIRRTLINPVTQYLEETLSRYPFSDWYDTRTGSYCHFKGRSVQGGIFMPIFADSLG